MFRRANPPKEIKEELEKLLDEWTVIDDDKPFEDYLDEHASDKMKAYIAEAEQFEDEDM